MDLLGVARKPPAFASPEMSVAEAVSRMVSYNVGAVIVAGSDRRVQGIFTERDVLRRVSFKRLNPDDTILAEVMTTPVETVTAETSVEDALARMIRGHFRHLPIVDTCERAIAIVSLRYLLMRRLGENRLLERLQNAFEPAAYAMESCTGE